MTNQEFSDTFTILLNSYNSQASFGEQASQREIVLDEYEKSVLLTQAQEEIVINLYTGRNSNSESFESTEELRRYLDNLIKTKVYSQGDKLEDLNASSISSISVLYKLPDDLAFITLEQVTYGDESLGCYNGVSVTVTPVTQDEYGQVKDNPFRGPTKYKVLRLDAGNNTVELISKYNIDKYLIRYLSKPEPIILEPLQGELNINGYKEEMGCKLNPILHNTILKRAVQLALQIKGNTAR